MPGRKGNCALSDNLPAAYTARPGVVKAHATQPRRIGARRTDTACGGVARIRTVAYKELYATPKYLPAQVADRSPCAVADGTGMRAFGQPAT